MNRDIVKMRQSDCERVRPSVYLEGAKMLMVTLLLIGFPGAMYGRVPSLAIGGAVGARVYCTNKITKKQPSK